MNENMFYPVSLSPKDRRRVFVGFVLLLTLFTAGLSIGFIQNSLYLASSHRIYPFCYSLYKGYTGPIGSSDTPGDKEMKNLRARSSAYVRVEKDGDLVIEVPNAASGRYKILFFDEWNRSLFEVKPIRDPYLIVEKHNFLRAGLFQYELYRDNILVERNTFLIKKE